VSLCEGSKLREGKKDELIKGVKGISSSMKDKMFYPLKLQQRV
jgi:hypothetical protein